MTAAALCTGMLALMLAGSAAMATAGPKTATATSPRPAVPARAATTNWVETFAATPEGGFRRGNPAARVKLVEYGSLTCTHCREFHGEAMRGLLGTYVASGKVSYEYRSFVLNGPDMGAALVARCSGNAKSFFSALNSFYPDQPQWTQPFTTLSDDDSKRLAALPPDRRIAALAVTGKLDSYAATLGMSRARFDTCVGDKAQADRLVEIRRVAVETYKVTGTPGFILNGQYLEDVFGWAALEPKLQAALAP
jgi:protein-disulfide isomerase